ncbi:MAG: response regulator [bacterium]|nr:response regulator [bacterium]
MKSILIADDSPTIRKSVELSIKGLGLNIVEAENGSDALNKVKQMKNDDNLSLCIVDVNMPVMDGLTFLRNFREIDKFTPVIVLTTEFEEAKIKEGKDAGASGWIVKPFNPGDFLELVNKFVK